MTETAGVIVCVCLCASIQSFGDKTSCGMTIKALTKSWFLMILKLFVVEKRLKISCPRGIFAEIPRILLPTNYQHYGGSVHGF